LILFAKIINKSSFGFVLWPMEKPHDEFTKRRIDRGGQGSGDYVFKGPSASEIFGYSDALKLMAFIDDIILLISSMF
jgi:hypothetical protein